MPACSRCGATDNRHSMKCLQAMALGWAMGVEERPELAAIAETLAEPERETSVFTTFGGDAALLDSNLALVAENADLRRRLDAQSNGRGWPAVVQELRDTITDRDATIEDLRFRLANAYASPVTHLPAGYYDEKHVSAERLADIEREVAELNASPHLDVVVHGPVDATVTPIPAPEPAAEPLAAPEAPPVPEATPARQKGVPGSFARPTTLAAEAAAQEYVETHLVPATGTRTSPSGQVNKVYVTAPELLAAFEAWAKANDKPVIGTTPRYLGAAATKKADSKHQGPVHDGKRPACYFGVKLATDDAAPVATAKPGPPEGSTEHIRALMQKARSVKTETIPEPTVELPHSEDELAIKLAQLKHFGIGGEHGVDRASAETAVADLHPTGRDVWKWVAPQSARGISDADLDATAYQLLVKCMNGLPEEYGYDYKDEVLATAGFRQEDVDAAIRKPQRVEIRPESWDKEKRYPILSFHRGDVTVIVGMLTPEKPRVIAAYWTSLLSDQSGNHDRMRGGGGGSRKSAGLPSNPGQVLTRLRAEGCEIPEPVDEKPVEVTYKGQSLGKIMTARTTTKITTQADYQRTLRKMQAINRREEAKVG